MTVRTLLAALAAAAALSTPAAPPSGCQGTLSGAVKGSFRCVAGVVTQNDTLYFTLESAGGIDGVPGFAPGSFEIGEKVEARTYTLDSLGVGRASVAAEGGTLYIASKTSAQRGEVTLALRSVRPDPRAKGGFVIHGSYRARLPPAGAGKKGEVVVEASF